MYNKCPMAPVQYSIGYPEDCGEVVCCCCDLQREENVETKNTLIHVKQNWSDFLF
jgi:hypothetical protein